MSANCPNIPYNQGSVRDGGRCEIKTRYPQSVLRFLCESVSSKVHRNMKIKKERKKKKKHFWRLINATSLLLSTDWFLFCFSPELYSLQQLQCQKLQLFSESRTHNNNNKRQQQIVHNSMTRTKILLICSKKNNNIENSVCF